MKKSKFSPAQVKKITGASSHELVNIPHYHCPPFLEVLREKIKQSLSSSGGRPTLHGADLVRKVRFSEEIWNFLVSSASSFSTSNFSISPAQIASFLLEETVQEIEARTRKNLESSPNLVSFQNGIIEEISNESGNGKKEKDDLFFDYEKEMHSEDK